MLGMEDAFKFDEEIFSQYVKTNITGPVLTAKVYLPYIERSQKKTIVNMSGGLGSISSAAGPIAAMYAMSKSALNMLVSDSVFCLCWYTDLTAIDCDRRPISSRRRERTSHLL